MKRLTTIAISVLLLGSLPASAAGPVYTETLYGGLLDSIAQDNGANLLILYQPGFNEVQLRYGFPLSAPSIQNVYPPVNRLPDVKQAEIVGGWAHLTLYWQADNIVWHVQWQLPDAGSGTSKRTGTTLYIPNVNK